MAVNFLVQKGYLSLFELWQSKEYKTKKEGLTMPERPRSYSMPMTLEKHFQNLADHYPEVEEARSLWLLLKKRIEDELIHSRSVFVNYSLHDGSHSRSIIQAIERFLGEERITQLSATDTFMLLSCTYAHDYGMARAFNKIYNILGSAEFMDFLKEKGKNQHFLEEEDRWAVNNLLKYVSDKKASIDLKDIYFSIMLVIQLYIRPTHWQGVLDIKNDFKGLFLGHLKKRFIHGSEGIVEICMCHGQSIKELLELPFCADGMMGDDYHPRFVASMLRLGDLLDLDNGRFPMWFINEIAHDNSLIPNLSIQHFRKHEAVSHLLVTPDSIEIVAKCHSSEIKNTEETNLKLNEIKIENAQKESYEVARLISEWTELLSMECHEMVLNWDKIAQPNFGFPPANLKVKIYVDGNEYMSENRALQMQMSQERVMNLLEGTSIYKDRYVGIREMIQNAIDASLLQLWKDLIENRYISYDLSKDKIKSGLDLIDFLDAKRASIFGNYDIVVEAILDKLRKQVFIVVKDKGIGITVEEVEYMSDIGSSKEKNMRIRKLMEKMPEWLKPSGVFGIGLQSVFQLTDCVEFYTRQHNAPERLISLYSYGKNRGKIEDREVPDNEDGPYFDNAIPGTNVKITINPEKFQQKKWNSKNVGNKDFIYYDSEFDSGEEIDMLFAEISKACEDKIKETRYDYFNVNYHPIRIDENGVKTDENGDRIDENGDRIDENGDKIDENLAKKRSRKQRIQRKSYIYHEKQKKIRSVDKRFGKSIQDFPRKPTHENPYCFEDNMAYFWDATTYRCYCLTVRPFRIEVSGGKKHLILPEKVSNLYNISYKFNVISKAESVYMTHDYMKHNYIRRSHAGFIQLDVLILDGNPTKYMNIDRDRLREDAIDEEELLAVRKDILIRWCQYFCMEDSQKYSRKNNSQKTSSDGGRFQRTPGILFSLIFLFYQNVSEELFEQFIEPYKEFVNYMDLSLQNEDINVSQLWNPNCLFKVNLPFPKLLKTTDLHLEGMPAFEIHWDNICRFPHRLIHIKKIRQEGEHLSYYLHLLPANSEVHGIGLCNNARLHDYLFAFDAYEDHAQNIDYDSIQKKGFKPDERFPNLLVPCLPHTFHKGRNLQSEFDYCIEWYILSPFDKESVKILQKGIVDEVDIKQDLTASVENSRQCRKCISYIMKKRFPDCTDTETIKQKGIIMNEYKQFIGSFWELLSEHRDFLRNMFKSGN